MKNLGKKVNVTFYITELEKCRKISVEGDAPTDELLDCATAILHGAMASGNRFSATVALGEMLMEYYKMFGETAYEILLAASADYVDKYIPIQAVPKDDEDE